MFLVDPGTRRLVPASDRVVHRDDGEDEIDQELFLQQVEIQSAAHRSMPDVIDDLRRARRTAASAAESVGARLAAMPTPVLADQDGVVTAKARYERMMSRFGAVGHNALVCGMHVHVDIVDDKEGVAVLDRLRPWLPIVLALSANSPYDLGVDTAFASWRSQLWEAWPTAGAVEPFGDAAGYHRAVDSMVASGAAIDEAMIYFDARLSRSFPTVEVRVADVCTDLPDAAVIAAIVRALVESCAMAWRDDQPVDPWRVDLLRAARWRARQDGLNDSLVHPLTRQLVPCDEAVDALAGFIGPALDGSGDTTLVEDGLSRLLRHGNGATHQRRVAGPRLDLTSVVDDVLERTHASFSD